MRATSGDGRPSRARRRVRRTAIALAMLASFSPLLGGTASAATTAELNARAASITAALDRANVELAAIGERYLAARSEQSAASAAEGGDRVALAHLDTALALRRRALVRAAVAAYVNGGTDTLPALLGSSADELAATATYLRVASNKLSGAIVALGRVRRRRDLEFDSARLELAAANGDATRALGERAAALGELDHEHELLSSVKGQLAVLVAAQRAAAARAAAAAAAAAAAKLAAANSSTRSTVAGPPSTVPDAPANPIPPGSLQRAFAGIRSCESGGIYTLDTGNGYYGAYQFAQQTWIDLGESGLPSSAPSTTQDAAAYKLYRSSGFTPWPECAAILGL